MAVGIVVGAAFTDLVKAFVSDWITPLVSWRHRRQLAGADCSCFHVFWHPADPNAGMGLVSAH
jgi:large-conductance mechanosensitive channel